MRRRKTSRFRAFVVLLLILSLVWVGGLVSFAAYIPQSSPVVTRQADAIVVLTGGSERLPAGIGLLEEGVADRLFVTGVHTGVDVAEILDLNAQVLTTLACCIDLGHDARHTVGNARETANWMASGERTSMFLVTANYHMPRSLVLFRRMMPTFEIIPYPVDSRTVRMDIWWRHPRTLILLAGEYSKFLVSLFWPPE